MNKYKELKQKHQEEVNKFPMAFAFSKEQVKEGLVKLGLKENDVDKVVAIAGGGFIKKTDVQAYDEMFDRQYKELQDAIKNDVTGEGFVKDMFDEELGNNEYGYTRSLTDTLMAVGLAYKDIVENENLKNGLNLALKRYEEKEEEQEV